jgi:Phytanoyl-CoA dioxygenase (PhyH)
MPLSSSQFDSFQQSGYVKLPRFLPPALLQRLRDLFTDQMTPSKKDAQQSVYTHNGKEYITNLDILCNKGNLACLELLGSPFLLEIAEQICGPDFFMIQEFAVIKNAGDELPVLWHQDMVHEGKGNCFTVGFYLDDVEEGDGALRVVPGSHRSGEPICALKRLPYIEVPMQAGDMLVHDMMLAHSSEPMRRNQLRRVLYFEFLSRRHVLLENIYSEALVLNRTKLLHAAMHYYRKLHPGEPRFIWKNELAAGFAPVQVLSAELNSIYNMPIQARPSTYCLDQFGTDV